MFDVVFSREVFSDGTVLYNVDVEELETGEIVFNVPVSFDTVEQAEDYAVRELFKLYADARWRYAFLSAGDYAGSV